MTAVGFTGTRGDLPRKQYAALSALIDESAPDWASFHHGSCVGSDAMAHRFVQSWEHVKIHVWPPLNRKFKAYLIGDVNHTPMGYAARNCAIVQHSDRLLACPAGPEEDWPRSGTWMTVRIARRMDVPTTIIWPDGQYTDGG